MILQQEEIIRLFIPHMIEIINGKYAAITKTIQADKFTYNGQTLSIFALGRLGYRTAQRKSVPSLRRSLLMEHFGISAEVVFKNDQDVYRKAAERLERLGGRRHKEQSQRADQKKSGGSGCLAKQACGEQQLWRPENRMAQTGEGDACGGKSDYGKTDCRGIFTFNRIVG